MPHSRPIFAWIHARQARQSSLLELVPPPALSGHAHTQYSECPLVVVVHPLGPLLGPEKLTLQISYSQRS